MTQDPAGDSAAKYQVPVHPLLPADPPKVGEFWLDARLTAAASGAAFAAHDAHNRQALLILLSEGAATDAVARDRFSGQINPMHVDHVLARGGQDQDLGRLARKYVPLPEAPEVDPRPLAPWVALSWDGGPNGVAEAERILATLSLDDLPLPTNPSGPDYSLHWITKSQPGLARLWPLPWPGRYDRAGWVTILVAWLLMLLLAALAVFIAIEIFKNVPPRPPDGAGGSGSPSVQSSPQSGQSSPESGPPTTGSASASPSAESGSPSPGETGSPTPGQSGSPSPGSPSPGESGSPTPGESGSPSPGESPGGGPTPTGATRTTPGLPDETGGPPSAGPTTRSRL